MSASRIGALQRAMGSVGDMAEVAKVVPDLFREDAVWHWGGSNPMSGHHRGRDAIRDCFAQIHERTQGTIRVEPVEILDGDRFTMSFTRRTAVRDGRSYQVLFADAFRWDSEDKVEEYWSLADDQDAYDAMVR